MAKRSKTSRPKRPRNMDRIGAGTKTQIIKDANGNAKWAESFGAGKKTDPSAPTVSALKSTSSLTPPSRAAQTTKPPEVTKGAAAIVASQKSVKPAVKAPPVQAPQQGTPSKIHKGAEKIIAAQREIKPAKTTPSPAKKPPVPGR